MPGTVRIIEVVTPSLPQSRSGNTVTAERWTAILRELGYRVTMRQETDGAADLLIALHARKSADSIEQFHRQTPEAPIIVGLAGTDLYGDLESELTQRSLARATRLVVLQPLGLERVPADFRDKVRVIRQSAKARPRRPVPNGFPVCVVGNLREVKDPFRAARAAALLPASSRVRILHAGAALSDEMQQRAQTEAAENPRYEWLGEIGHIKALELIASSRCLVHSSRAEGGANVLSEALAAAVPILSSNIPGSVGVLGPDYPGFFPVGDTAALAELLHRAETEPTFYSTLENDCRRLAPLTDPAREKESWASLLAELAIA